MASCVAGSTASRASVRASGRRVIVALLAKSKVCSDGEVS